MKQMSEKIVDKNKSLYAAYMDLVKVYERVDREAIQHVLGMYGIDGQLLKEVQSLYETSEACVRVYREEGEWSKVARSQSRHVMSSTNNLDLQTIFEWGTHNLVKFNIS